ncbi:MAG: helix-turn-helix transcriptional regulator, partial [Anaerolineae bacterium]|nr:helix-turn-helix transcriptional regulator [Anaerolineae bacterium]
LTNLESTSGDEILSLLQSPQPPSSKAMLTVLISHLETFPQHFVLVLDDYHVITTQTVHDAVAFLVDHLPPQMHLVLTSREDPPFPLARLRGRGQLSEIRVDDLRFTPDEAALFLQQALSIDLSTQQLAELDRRTEGWIAGLQLAALAMKGREDVAGFISAFTGSHRFILDYLIEEVLSRQSEDLQNFLLQTSILSRLSGPLCNAVTGRTDGQQALEQIEHGNMFLIGLDDERYWYRYHHLFAEVLRNRLIHTRDGQLAELHRRASIWFEENGWVGESVEHAILSQDSERVARLIESHGDRIWMRGEVVTLLRWLEALSDESIRMRPKLGLNHAFMLTAIDAFVEAEQRLLEIEPVLASLSDVDAATHTALLGQAATIRATIAIQLDYPEEITLAAGNQALAQLPESLVQWRAWAMMIVGNAQFAKNGDMATAQSLLEEATRLAERADDLFTHLVALAYLTQIYLIQGRLGQIEATCQSLFQRAGTLSWKGRPALGVARMSRAWVRYERNELMGAYEDVIEGQQATEGYELKRVCLPSFVLLARLERLRGDELKARELMQQAVEMMHRDRLIPASIAVSAWQAWLWLKQDDLASAIQWAQEIEPTTYG